MRQLRTTLAALMVVLVAEICSASRPPPQENKEEEATTARLEIRSDPDQRHNYREINLPSLSRNNQAGGLSVRIMQSNDEAKTKTRVRRWDYSSYNNDDGGWGPKRQSFYDRRPYRVPSDFVFPSDRRRQQQSRPPNRRNSQVNRFNKPTSRRPFRIYPVFPG